MSWRTLAPKNQVVWLISDSMLGNNGTHDGFPWDERYIYLNEWGWSFMVNQPVNTRSSHGSNVGDQSLMFGTNPLVNHGINPPRKLIGPGFLFGIKEVVYESCCQLVQKLGKKNRIYVCIYIVLMCDAKDWHQTWSPITWGHFFPFWIKTKKK